jgi:carboxyl-terminal processing protease
LSSRSPFFRLALSALTGLFLVALAFGSGFVMATFQPRQPGYLNNPHSAVLASGSLSVFGEAWELIEQDFFGSLPPNRERVYGAIRGLLGALDDPYTVFVEPVSRQLEQDNLRGHYGGVGVTLGRDADGKIMLSPFRDSPAANAGILEGDVLVAIDELYITSEMDLSQDVEARIRGEVGTYVTLAIQRGEETLVFTITRKVIQIPSVTWRMLEQAPSLGYVRIKSFSDRTAGELQEGLDDVLADGAQGLVLDLRDNGGGLLQASIDVTDQFLDGGPVLYERRKGQEEEAYMANSGGLAIEIPLVVLINHGTASASEIVAGALQDRGRGILIGEPTFGKGSVQLIFDLTDGSSVHITAAQWYTPDHHQLDSVGLVPDVTVGDDSDSGDGEDVQLERAVQYLQQGK